MDKTKVLRNNHVSSSPVTVGSSVLEPVDEYVYLGHIIRLGRANFEKEINRRIKLG